MAKKWSEVVSNPAYQKLRPEQQEEARNEYFEYVVKPNVPEEDLGKARAEFDDFSTTSTGEKIANVYKEGLTGLKDMAVNAAIDPLRKGAAIIGAVDNRSVTNNYERSLDGTSPEATGFDQSAGDRVLKDLTTPQQETLKAGSRIVDGLSGVAEVGLRKGYAGLGRIEAGAISAAGDLLNSDTLHNVAADQLKHADQVENAAVLRGTKSTAFEPDSIVQEAPRVATDAIGSTITSAPAVIAGAVAGGGALPAIFATTALSDYGTAGDQLNTGGKIVHAIGTGAAETLGEKLGGTDKFADALTRVLGGKNALAELGARLLISGAKEIPSEEVTTTAQFLLDKSQMLGLNQDATLDDYINQVKETAKVAAMQGAGMTGAGGVIKAVKLTGEKPDNSENDAEAAKQSALNAWKTNGLTTGGQRLTISQGDNAADDAQQAQILANKAEKIKTLPDANLQNLRKTAQTLNPTDVPLIDAEIERRANLGTLSRAAEISQQQDPLAMPQIVPAIPANNEAIHAADLLEGNNVSNLPSAVPADVVAEATQPAGNNVQGSVGNLPNQPAGWIDTGRTNNATQAPAQSGGSDQPIGNGSQGNAAITSIEDRPFASATDDFLPQMRGMTDDEMIISQIDAELRLRGMAVNNQENVAGGKINKEWTAFSPETGTLNIPRSEMPQIKAEHRGAMVNFLNARGISHEQETVPASSLKPTQQEFSEAKVKQASEYVGGDRSILISSDNHVLDGHHQWLSKLNNGEDVDVIRLNAPISKLLGEVHEFPSATTTNETVNDNKTKKTKEPKHKTLLATLRDLGGVALTEKQDITGEVRGFAPAGYNQIFKTNTTRTMKGLIESGDLDEYLPYNMRLSANGMNDDAYDSTEAYDYLADKIRNGDSVLAYEVEEELKALRYEGDAVADVTNELTEDEINGKFQQASNEEREGAANARIFDTKREDGGTAGSIRTETGAQANADQQAEIEAPSLELTGQTNADVEADIQNTRNQLKEAKAQEESDKQAAIDKERNARQEIAADNFDLTQTGKDAKTTQANDAKVIDSQFAGQGDLLSAPKSETKSSDTQKAKDEALFANNKVFTADKVAAARARLKSKLNTLNSGIDPELLIDGMTIAGAYIETGVRKFSDYAKAMTDDFGDSIKPYLLSFYEAVRAYPNIDKSGMTDAEAAAAEHQALLTPEVKELAKEVIGQGVVESPKVKAKQNGQLKLTQDWGVDDINGYDSDRDDGRGGEVKDAFLSEAKKYLVQVEKLLEAQGFEPHKDQRGRLQKAVSVNESGIATSGEVSLTMRKGNTGVYVNIGASSIRGLTGNHPQAVSVMIRTTDNADTDRYANKGQNIWLSTDLSSTELANKLMQTAERYVKNTEHANEDTQNARTTTSEKVPARSTQSDLLAEQPRGGDSKPLDSGLARPSEGAAGQGRVSSDISESGRNGTTGIGRSNRNEPSSGSRETSNAGNSAGTANGLNDFEITDETGIGDGSLAQKYKDNINAIKLIKTLESEGRVATPEERNQLAKYNGFGALSKVFEKDNPKYEELKSLLAEDEYAAAKASILNAYYTSPTIVNSMYDAISHMGFKGGRVLEPSLGSGNFFGMMPTAMRNKSKLNGVELDVITSRLAKYLYPNANIAVATGFEKYQAPQGYFDLVVSNPPFGSEQLRDSEKTDYSGFSIHNFFIAKSIDKLRDNGILAVVVSHNFMDAMDTKAREWISKRAILRGAVRLPKTAFKDNAGTEVITDILYFQKTNMPEVNPDWVKSSDHGDYFFNDYFSANPMNVLGRVDDITSQYGKTYTVESTGDMAKQLKEFIAARLLPDVYVEPEQRIEVLDSADSTVPDSVKVGTYYKDDKDVIRQRMPDLLGAKRSSAWEAPNAKAQERMLGMMALRDLLRSQMRLERDPMATEKEIERNRERLNSRYDEFQKKHGYLNSVTNRRLFLDDTESALLQALELDYDQGVTAARSAATGMEEKSASAQKADILKRRVLFPPSDAITVNNAKDALLASLNVKGVVDADYMAELYNKSADGVISELGDVVYDDPQKGYVTADEYLSGDVKTKLAEAKAKAAESNKFARNVDALENVIPKDKVPSEIYASAGANWIPADVYAEFASEITGIPVEGIEYTYVKSAAMWLSEKTRGGDVGKMTSDYGTPDINAFDMFHLLINGKAPEVKETIGSGSDRRTVTNIEKTEAARSKYEKVKETWNSWIFKDATRADKLATIYNEKHNRTVARKFDGSHMQFYGMSPAVTLYAHQKDVVWRAIQDRNVLLDHVVGAGKTMAMASIAMEMKRLGIARKPVFVVPNHLTLQWRSEFTKLYPASNILAATPDDFAKDKREKLFSKMVTGSYDAIIIGHSSLTKIGLPAEIEGKMYADQVKELSDAIESAKTARGDRGITRDMEKIKKNLEAKIEKLKEKAGAKDNVVTFDELGIDALFVDEMHEFKNLFFTTQMQRTAGLGNPSGSGKALDMFMKVKFMTDTYGEDVPLITATGTPVSNSLAEMFTMQRYMKYPEMKRQDLHLFDAWAKQFGEVENVYEVAPSGVGYRQSTRFSKFKNLPALMGSYTSFADIITMQDLKDQTATVIDEATGKPKVFPVPKLRTGKPINVIAQRSELQRDFFGVPQLAINESTGEILFELEAANAGTEETNEGKFQIIQQVKNEAGEVIGRQAQGSFDTREEAELELVTKSLTPKTYIDPKSLLGQFANLAQLTRESNGKINALSLTGLANKSGLDYRIIDPSAPDFEGSKINLAVTNMVDLWKETTKDKGTQIVFCDLSIPNSARNDMSGKERRIYVRDRDGELTHKAKGVVYAPEGYEGFPFFITKGRYGFEVYEAVTGTLVRDYNLPDKAAAKAWVANYVESESSRDRIFTLRDTKTIDQSDIDEYRETKELEVADDGSNEISTADLEAVAGSSKFSVYDDIRIKLIKAGVPENQIAFIHDYNTPKQKEELFKRVNSGDVRFLFGSTPKLGAGTNVQKRLVGLHHIDAPWRPSDLEQREGRIIRQGNDLYARDPDNFEIAIWRYATEQTYDTRRWQLLEHKAAGIEQLRKYTGEVEIDDVASEASNSADMKAAASGNPLILEETKLRTEVKRLINLEKAHTDSQYAMARKIKNNTEYINNYWPNKISEYKDTLNVVNQHPTPEDKAKVASLKVDGALMTSREKAEAAIGALALKVRSLVTLNETPKVIQYRGVDFTVSRGFMLNSLALRSPDGLMHTYGEKEGVSPSGLITRFNNYIDSISSRIDDVNDSINKATVENESLSKRVNDPFEYGDKLKETQAEHASVQRRLMKSSQLESVPEDQRPEFDRLVKGRKEALKKLGFEKALKESESDNDESYLKKPALFSRSAPRTPFIAQSDEGYLPALNEVVAMFKSGDQQKVREAGKTPIPISRTPVVLRQVMEDNGSKPFKRAEFIVGQGSTLYLKADNVHSRSIHTGRISKDVLDNLPQLLADPIAVFKSSPVADDAKSFKVLIDALDENGDPIIVAIKPNVPMQQLNNAEVHFQATIFPAKWDKVREWNKDGLLRYYNEKSPRASRPASYPLGTVSDKSENTREGFDANIGVSASKVKVISRDDIEAMPEAAFSRTVVNKGMPKATIQTAVNNLRSKWKNAPQIIVVEDMNDPAIRKAVREENDRQLSQGAQGQPEAFFDAGKVYVVASEMNNANDVIRVVFHETLGHYGLRGLYGKELGAILDQIALLRKRDMVVKAKAYGLDLKVESDRRIAAEEVLAEMAQTAPSAGFVKRAVAAIRKFLRSIGIKLELTDNDIIVNYLLPARNFVANQGTKNTSGVGVFSRNNKNLSFAQEVLNELADNDEFFRYELSKSSTLKGVMNDVALDMRYIGDATREDERSESGADKRTLFRNESGKDFFVYEKGRDVWIDVSRFDEGDAGGAVYSAVGNYAHNADKQFIGDPAGLSEAAVVRRTKHMLGLALRFGTTKFMQAAPEQIKGNPAKGIAPLKWSNNDVDNVRDLIHTFVTTTENQFPAISNYEYNFGRRDFTTKDGRSVSGERFSEGAKGEVARGARAGTATQRAAILTRSLIQSASRQESAGILQDVLSWSNSLIKNGGLTAMFSRNIPNPIQSRLTPQWETLEDSDWTDDLIRKLQDKNIDLKRVTQSIKAAGVNLADRWNAYLQEELYHGRTAKRIQDFLDNELNPMIEDMRTREVSMADFEEYLWNRHAEERNIQIAKVNPEMPDGGSGKTTAQANTYLDALTPAQKADFEALAARIDAINAGSRQVLVDYGLESMGTVAAWDAAYKHYVPLQREEMDFGFGTGTGQGFSVKGDSSKRALGSTKNVVDIVANIAQQRERNIIRGEKNRVATALIGLAKTNPNEDFWQVDTPPRIRMISKETGLVEEYTDPTYKNHPNVVVARIVNRRGEIEERSVVFEKSNQRAMQLAASIKNLDIDQMESLIRNWIAPVTRYIASVNTQYNPIFGILNVTRDVQGALLNLTTTPIAGKQKEVLKLTGKAMAGIYKEMRSVRAGSGTVSNQWATLWEEFQREGGKTGYRDMFANAEDRTKALEKALDPTWWTKTKLGKVVSVNGTLAVPEEMVKDKFIKPIFNWLSDYNETLENAVRLATYKVAIDSGISKQQAASIAKNISVNFNRKGNMGQNMNAIYAFFNASVQGTARIGETLTGRRGQQIVAGGLLLGAVQAVMMMAAGFGDDEPPQFVRDRNVIIPLGNKKYSTIPMPLGFNAIPNLGRILTEWALSGFDKTNDRFVHILSMLLETFNPVGGNGSLLNILMPTVADPIVDLSLNQDWTGRPISKEDFNKNAQTAGFTRSRDKTWTVSRELARYINLLSGGTEYAAGKISPTGDAIEYLAGQAFGGVGRELIKAGTTVDALLTGEDLPPYKVPLVGRFYGNAEGQSAQGAEFYNNLRMLGKHETEIKGRRADKISTQDYRKENPESALIAQAKQSQKIVSNLQKIKQRKVDAGAPAAEIKAVDDRITNQMKKLNELVRKKSEGT